MVQWLGLCAFTFRAQVQILIGELRSCKLCNIAKKRKKKLKGEERLTWQSRKSLSSPPSTDTPKLQLFTKKLLMGKARRQAEKRSAAKDTQKEPHQYRQEGRSSNTIVKNLTPGWVTQNGKITTIEEVFPKEQGI